MYLSNISTYLFNQYVSAQINKFLLSDSATISPIPLAHESVLVGKVQLRSQKLCVSSAAFGTHWNVPDVCPLFLAVLLGCVLPFPAQTQEFVPCLSPSLPRDHFC